MKIYTIGGYNEVGKNMTAVQIGEDVVIFDAGLYLPPIVELEEREDLMHENKLRNIGAIPEDTILDSLGLRNKVRAIMAGHAHLDHIGAIPYISDRYNADILGTPFTTTVLKTLLSDEDIMLKNKIRPILPNSSCTIDGTKKYTADFINVTHSTLQSALMALHTPEGVVLYANDFKLDNSPILGKEPNYAKIHELSKEGVKALIVESLYAAEERKTPSEKVARTLLEDVMLTTDNTKGLVVVTTFSSHIARLKSIVDFAKKLNRTIIFAGRSLGKYVSAAKTEKLCPFVKDIQLLTYRKQIESAFRKINSHKTDYLLVCTGHQGEPESMLDRISRSETPLRLGHNDHVIFSSKTIPTEINIANKGQVDKRLKEKGVRIFNEVHVSVLPDTEVVLNGSKGMKIKEIGKIEDSEKKELRVPAFTSDLKIKWLPARLVEHDYNGKIFSITTKSGRNVSITSGHSLFKLERGSVISEIGDNIREGDYLAIPKTFSWDKSISNINIENYLNVPSIANYKKENGFLTYNDRKICPINIELNTDFARLLGYYLAEGSSPRHISLVIGNHEKEILEDIKKSAANVLPSNLDINERGNSYEICFGARILGRLFKNWFGNNAKTKKIPEFVFSASKEFKLNFLGAYINGDGCIDKGKKHFRIRIKTASKKLASDLMYLFSHAGICAKFDHVEKNPARKIAGNKKETPETFAYVIRIQGANYLKTLEPFLSSKFQKEINPYLSKNPLTQQLPPESLPVEKLNFEEIEAKTGTYLHDIKYYNSKSQKKKKHISPELIKQQSLKIDRFTNLLLNGELLFDPVKKIEVSDYIGKVFDFQVPGAENFIGGFGGIMLHNSGHAGREDLRDFISMVNPEHIIPAHGDLSKLSALTELASEMGYKIGKNCHISQNLNTIKI